MILRPQGHEPGELTNPDSLDVMVLRLTWAGALTLAVSWAFLALVILQTTAAEKAVAANSNGPTF